MKRPMPPKKTTSSNMPRFNYDLLIDLTAGACILVVAGRPDALAITFSAIIIAVAALIYRASVGVKTYLSGSSGRGRVDTGLDDRQSRPNPPEVTGAPPASPGDRTSWLRE